MQGDAIEAARRRKLAENHNESYPNGSKVTFSKKLRNDARAFDYLSGYEQACRDLLTPQDTPGKPATAITLLNRVGQMVLKNRAEVLAFPPPRHQCPGCFCIMVFDTDRELGWCHNCFPHRLRLVEQLRANQEEATITAGPQEGVKNEKTP